jgi:hypothetical protein
MARKDSKNPNSKGKVDVKKVLKDIKDKPVPEPSDKLKNKKF